MGGRGAVSSGNRNQETVLAQLANYFLQPLDPLLPESVDTEIISFGTISSSLSKENFSREAAFDQSGTFDPNYQIVSGEQGQVVISTTTNPLTPAEPGGIEASQTTQPVSDQAVSRTGRNSRYVVVDEETGRLMLAPEYRVTTTRQQREPGEKYRPVIRSRFYGTRNNGIVTDWMNERLSTPYGQTTPNGYSGLRHPTERNLYWWNGKWWEDNGPTRASIEHKDMPVVDHWNSRGNNQTQAERRAWYNELENLEIMPRNRNSAEGAREHLTTNFTFEVGENFSGPRESVRTSAQPASAKPKRQHTRRKQAQKGKETL